MLPARSVHMLTAIALAGCAAEIAPTQPRPRDAAPPHDAVQPDAPSNWPHVDPFVIELGSTALRIRPGDTAMLEVAVLRAPGFDRTVELRAWGLPDGLEAPEIDAASGVARAIVPIHADRDAQPRGARAFALVASAGGVRQSHRITIEIVR